MANTCLATLAGVVLACVGTVYAQEAEMTDTCQPAKADWSVCRESSPKQCWAASEPIKSVNTRGGRQVKVKRDDTMLFVRYQPDADIRGEVAFTGGYPFKPGSVVEMSIGSETFKFATDQKYQEWAWPPKETEAKIVDAMKRGNRAVMRGLSTRGTKTTDTFSLIGFTAALEEAARNCQ